MATPSGSSAHSGIVPSSSYLQQLLEEVKGAAIIPRALLDRPPPLSPQPAARGRRSSSVWTGGAPIAQDARDKLRAADEARYGFSLVDCGDAADTFGGLTAPASSPHESSQPGDGTFWIHEHDASESTRAERSAVYSDNRKNARNRSTALCQRSKFSSQQLSNPSPADVAPSWAYGATELASSFHVDDGNSDISATPSPTQVSSAATLPDLIDTKKVKLGHGRSAFEEPASSSSPAKRYRSRSPSLELFSKRFCIGGGSTPNVPLFTPPNECVSGTPTDCSGGDNFNLIRSATFMERAASIASTAAPDVANCLPDLSSFRPEVADAQGLPIRKLAASPMASRRNLVVQQKSEITPPETPIYARRFHLVDGDISIYKKDHGDEPHDYPLCLHCCRLHGSFNRLLEHGCETCGKEEPLESHYWDTHE